MPTKSAGLSPEVRARAVRMVFEHRGEQASEVVAITSIATKIGCKAETLRLWVRQAQRDQGRREGMTTDNRALNRHGFLGRASRDARGRADLPTAPASAASPSRSSWPGRLRRSDRSPVDDRWRPIRLARGHRAARRCRSAAFGLQHRGQFRQGPSRPPWPCLLQRSARMPGGLRWQKRSSASTRPR